MAAMLEAKAPIPSMSSPESDYHRFNLHRLEAASKAVYGDNVSSEYSSEGQTYIQNSTPKLSFNDMEVNDFLSVASDKPNKPLFQSHEEAPLNEVVDFIIDESAPLGDSSIFGSVCTQAAKDVQ